MMRSEIGLYYIWLSNTVSKSLQEVVRAIARSAFLLHFVQALS